MGIILHLDDEFDSQLQKTIHEAINRQLPPILKNQIESIAEQVIQRVHSVNDNQTEGEVSTTHNEVTSNEKLTPYLTSSQAQEFLNYTNYRMRKLRKHAKSLGIEITVEGRLYLYNRADLERYKRSISQ